MELVLLRAVHVLGGIFWVGSGLFTTLFLMPALAGVGPAAAPVMGALQRSRLFTVLPVVALLTVLSGLRLLWIASGGLDAAYFGTASGAAFAGAGALAVVAFAFGMAFARPLMARAGRLAATIGGARDDAERARIQGEVARLQRRGARANQVLLAALVVSALGMAVARYLH